MTEQAHILPGRLELLKVWKRLAPAVAATLGAQPEDR